MREEVRQKFEREVRKQWIKRGAYAAAALVVVAALAWFTDLDAHVDRREVAGVVEKVLPIQGGSTQAIQNGLNVDVRLDDGRHARVMVQKATHPEIGSHVAIIEHVHWSGRTTFSWK
jgi:hypothetical protein